MPFKKGQSGNPSGRPKGARQKLNEKFAEAMQEDFEKHGPAAIVKVRESDPAAYMRVIAGLMPKEVDATIRNNRVTSDLTDEELASIAASDEAESATLN